MLLDYLSFSSIYLLIWSMLNNLDFNKSKTKLPELTPETNFKKIKIVSSYSATLFANFIKINEI